jgi:hypothetical protein
MKNLPFTACAALLLVSAGCATQEPAPEIVGASAGSSPAPVLRTTTSPGSHTGHPWSAGGEAKGAGPVHVGHPWTAQWNVPVPAPAPVLQTSAPLAAPTATPAPAAVVAPAGPVFAPAATPTSPRDPAPARSKRTPRRSRG